MKKEEKQVMIDDLSKRLDENNIIYIADISNLDAVATSSTLFLSKILRIGPEAAEDAPVTLSPWVTDIFPLAKHLRKVLVVS